MSPCAAARETQPGYFVVSHDIEDWDVIQMEATSLTRICDLTSEGMYNAAYKVVDAGGWEHVYFVKERRA